MVRLTHRCATLTALVLLCIGCTGGGRVYDVPVSDHGTTSETQPPEIPTAQAPEPPPLTPAAQTLLAAAETAAESGDTELTIAHVERAIRIEPRRSELWTRLAAAYLADGRPQPARQYANKALALAADRGDLIRRAWLVIADIEAAEGNYSEARRIRRKYRVLSG